MRFARRKNDFEILCLKCEKIARLLLNQTLENIFEIFPLISSLGLYI